MPDAPLWQLAASHAARRHVGQLRKDRCTPYFSHCARVAQTISTVFDCQDEKVLAAAYLHDVIEDTPADYDEIAGAFGDTVADYVALLSKDMRLPEPDRERQFDAALAGAPWPVRLIKLADVYDNMLDAQNDTMLADSIRKTERALGLPGDEPELRKARQVVSEALAACRVRLAESA